MALKIEVSASAAKQPADTVRFVTKGEKIPASIPAAEFSGKLLSSALVREGKSRLLYVGLGETKELSAKKVSRAAGYAVRELNRLGATSARFELGKLTNHLSAAAEGAILGAYKFEEFKRPVERRQTELKKVTFLVGAAASAKARAAVKAGVLIGEGVNTTRSLGNLPPNVLTPASLASKARELARKHGLTARIFDHARLKKDGFGGILAVGGGSAHTPRLIVLEYNGGKKGEKPVALVGKAITFDAGGLSLKPSATMDEMKWDKMGGLTVLGIMQAVATLKLPINVVAVIASAENLLGAGAYRPSDIVTTYDGKTIEVLNTDAEGRIVLADALSYARKTYKPVSMFEFSTLTGACVVALGRERAGLFSLDEKLIKTVEKSSAATGDLVWNLPMGDEYDEYVKSEVATVKNIGERWGGACFAASFLQTWAEDVPFVHLDIAGTAWITRPKKDLEIGATGHGVRLLVNVLQGMAK